MGPKCLPMGSSLPKNFRANASLTTAIFGDSAVSCFEIARPRKIGIFRASKYPSVTRFQEEELSSLGAGAGCPSTQTPEAQPPPGGEYRHIATEDTPGMFVIESRMRR